MTSTSPNSAQAEQWAGKEGDHWVDNASRHDRMLAPFADRLMAAARLVVGERVLDLGCGNGATTIQAARAVGSTGAALGVDLSPQMLKEARGRAVTAGTDEWTRFEVADVQIADLGPQAWDVAVSRFGIMFFDDPTAAFANIADALRPGGRLVFCCWQPLELNDWMFVPGLAAAQHVPLPDILGGDEPGPFSLAEPDRTRDVLAAAGFGSTELEPFTTPVLVGGGGSIDETMEYLVTSGMGRALLENAPEPERSQAIEAVRTTLEPLQEADGVHLAGAAWIVTAQRP